ncbi:MAG: hypothetical protein N3D82_05475 [Ignisphaera sp.]|nr:hypothetical protein [Ignisphaera sp.]MCX8168456.1 hypothetical protein [Ignisphaera sp.]MDW8085104.1 hypothetical protein [Ignisphaera sp.]
MHLKRESRILIVGRLNDFIVGLIIRGIAGIENSVLFKNCSELYRFLSQGIGLAGEVNYIILNDVVCTEPVPHQRVKSISIDDVEDERLLAEIKEALKIMHTVSLRYTVYGSNSTKPRHSIDISKCTSNYLS